ncbi:MAG: polyphenol oxidase family protein [Acidimicrobiia bacterium]
MSLRPAGVLGAAFGEAADGDGRVDLKSRRFFSAAVGAPGSWAWVHQVHGTGVVEVDIGGDQGDADALFTRRPGVALSVGTADCFPVILDAGDAVGVAHSGWRGVQAGVVTELRSRMAAAGSEVMRAVIGPGIRPCCFEVGPEVAERFPDRTATTTWGTVSVDLVGAVRAQLDGVEVLDLGACTHHDERFHSHRRDRTPLRQVSIAWLPD